MSLVAPFIQVLNEKTSDYATLARRPRPLNPRVTGQASPPISPGGYVFVKQSLLLFAEFLYPFLWKVNVWGCGVLTNAFIVLRDGVLFSVNPYI